jgi:protein-S-isoprenylcysteine O-methyltransferase Ste14
MSATPPHRSLTPAIGSIVFFVLAPVTVAGWVPYLLTGWQMAPPFLGFAGLRVAGVLFVAFGAAGLVDSFTRFALQGRGTPAPIAPTEELVVSGLYRYARNPMYISVVSATVGQALLFGSLAVLQYGAIVWLLFHLFVIAYEEPTLRARYGRSYDTYRANVPRWLPRLRPWTSG